MALVLSQAKLPQDISNIVNAPTPQEFIKTKPGRGGKAIRFVEGGYVSSKMNQAFGPLNWNWEIIEHGESPRKTEKNTEGEVWVRGRLTVIDHAKGYQISKDSFGQHPIHINVPMGDALKAASTDAYKKAAAFGFGIALDVYWQTMDSGEKEAPTKTKEQDKINVEQMFARAREMIIATSDATMLATFKEKIATSKVYTQAQKHQLNKLIDEKISKK